MSYCVYKHTFPNGKVYIGITCQKPEDRWNNGKGYIRQPYIDNAIKKYGWDNIAHEIIYNNLSKEEAEQIEIQLIKEYKSNQSEFGYNIANGGNVNSKQIRCIETGKVYESSAYAGNELGILASSISGACCGRFNTAGGYHWEFINKELKRKSNDFKEERKKKNKFKKRVRCIETNIIYSSLSDASKQTGINNTCISNVCKGKQMTAGGYHWEFINENLKELYKIKTKDKRKKMIRCIETGEIYNSTVDVQNKTGINRSIISKVCNNKYESAGGYHWEFIKDDERSDNE